MLGTFVWDTVWTLADQAAGRPRECWGGMAFSMAAAAAALPPGWELEPLAHVGADLAAGVHSFLDTLPGIGSRAGIVAVPEPNNRVELVYTSAAERGERMRGGVPGWGWDELAPLLAGLDALYLNFFSGWELDLATARRLRSLGIPLYADLHSLFLGPPKPEGPRDTRPLPQAAEWLGCFHAVQLNHLELGLLEGELESQSAADLLAHGPQAVFVTRGAEGAGWAVLGNAGIVTGHAAPPRAQGDPTGAGDAWGITNFLGLLAGLSPGRAVARANSLAACKLAHRGGSGLYGYLDAHRGQWETPP
jgi:sugar/nucleoside kinase (ribokinase family)